jgi:hypothetical protein
MPEPAGGEPLWRVFPWDPAAEAGAPFSPGYVPPHQGSGRFDLPGTPVLYLAESAEHAVAEKIQRYRGQDLAPWDLEEFDRTLALLAVHLPAGVRLLDLCDPGALARHRIRPDHVAARSLETTRAVARSVHAAGFEGLRWWSSLFGEWHCVTVFLDRVDPARLAYGHPEPLHLDHPAVHDAADALAIRRVPPARR